MKTLPHILSLVVLASVTTASAQTIAQWTFESSVPTNAGPYNPEVGLGSASGFHAGAAVYSNPTGNGSAESYSVNTWAVGDYFEFSLSTVGYTGIGLSFDQTSSGTGPRDFGLEYSTDGSLFTAFAAYSVQANASPNPVWNSGNYLSLYSFEFDLSSVTALNNASSVYFRLIDVSTISANGGTVAASGTDRVDNVTVYVVPEPTSLLALGGLLLVGGRKLMVKRS